MTLVLGLHPLPTPSASATTPPNLLMSQSKQVGIDDCEKPAMTVPWARKMAPELHHYLRRQGYLRSCCKNPEWADTTCVCSPRPLPMSEEGCMRVPNIDTGRVILGLILMLVVSVTDRSP